MSFAAGIATAAVHAAEPIDIGSRRELFVDDHLVERREGTRLRLHPPRPAEIAIRYDQPWEDRVCNYTTVLQDGDTYRMYYRGTYGERTCYAESADGIHWRKPDLGLVSVDGSSANNVILVDAINFCPFLDPRPGIPRDERFKANAAERSRPDGGLVGYLSADGIRWRKLSETVLVPMSAATDFDTQNIMFWSEVEQAYLLYARHMAGGRRATMRSISKDFRQWTRPVPMTYSDTDSAVPSAHLYNNQTTPYFRAPHIYVSLPGRISFNDPVHVVREEEKEAAGRRVVPENLRRFYREHVTSILQGGLGDYSDGVLLTTRAGTTRYSFSFQESFVRPGIGLGNWTTRNNYPACGVVQTGPGEMSIYVQRHYGQRTGHLQRMTLRLDGFASLHTPYEGGEMVTKPLIFEGRELEINYSTSAAGGIRVEIQDIDGRPAPGFSLAESAKIIGDEISRTVVWQKGGDVSRVAGKPVRLRFVMNDADLYSLRFRKK